MSGLFGMQPFGTALEAGGATVEALRGEADLALWTIGRVSDDGIVVLCSSSNPYGVRPRTQLPWTGSLAWHMAHGSVPRVVVEVAADPVAAVAENGFGVPVRSFMGAPLLRPDGGLFGVLCGYDPRPRPDSLVDRQGVIERTARLFATLVSHELALIEAERTTDQLRFRSSIDDETGLSTRPVWNRMLSAEQRRCERLASPASVIMIRTSTDAHQVADVAALLQARRAPQDTAARLRADTIGWLLPETDRLRADDAAASLSLDLELAGHPASVRVATRREAEQLAVTWQRAASLSADAAGLGPATAARTAAGSPAR